MIVSERLIKFELLRVHVNKIVTSNDYTMMFATRNVIK